MWDVSEKEKSRMSPSFLYQQQMDSNVIFLEEESKKNEWQDMLQEEHIGAGGMWLVKELGLHWGE